jgi:NADH-quinone oxidoreductase subunit M
MSEWPIPFVSLLVLVPALSALFAVSTMRREAARRFGVAVGAGVLGLAVSLTCAWQLSGRVPMSDRFDPGRWCGQAPIFAVDHLNALLLPFVALAFAFVLIVQPRTHPIERSLRGVLITEAVTLAAFLSSEPLLLALLWCCSAGLGWQALRSEEADGGGATRVFVWYVLPSSVALCIGALLMHTRAGVALGSVLIALAVMIRKGIAPLHSWLPEMFARAPLPMSVLFHAPQIGAWVAIRVIAPRAPVWVLESISFASLLTAVYGAGLALVQNDPRRVLGWLFLSQSALILVGLQSPASVAQAGAVTLWIASGLSLTGFGMTLAALEARRGRLSLTTFAGGYERKPLLAASFLVLGLASVGFPGTLGFVGQEALALGVVSGFPHLGFAVLIAAMLNGITVLRTYFVLFCGRIEPHRVPQRLRPREQLGFVGLAALLVVAGLFPEIFLATPGKGMPSATVPTTRSLGAGDVGVAPVPLGAKVDSALDARRSDLPQPGRAAAFFPVSSFSVMRLPRVAPPTRSRRAPMISPRSTRCLALRRQHRGEIAGLEGEDRMFGGDLDGLDAQACRHLALYRGRYDLVLRAEHVGAGHAGN